MELLGKLEVDGHLLLAQVVNFGLLVFLLSFFLYKPLLRRIEEDEQKLKEAERIRAVIEQEKDAEAALLRRAHERAEAIIREAERIAQAMREEAAKEIAREKDRAIAQIHRQLRVSEGRKR